MLLIYSMAYRKKKNRNVWVNLIEEEKLIWNRTEASQIKMWDKNWNLYWRHDKQNWYYRELNQKYRRQMWDDSTEDRCKQVKTGMPAEIQDMEKGKCRFACVRS